VRDMTQNLSHAALVKSDNCSNLISTRSSWCINI